MLAYRKYTKKQLASTWELPITQNANRSNEKNRACRDGQSRAGRLHMGASKKRPGEIAGPEGIEEAEN